MAKKEHISETPATQFLRKQRVAFSEHPYEYEEHGGTAVSSPRWACPNTRSSRPW
jgi:prolyl-tRNA editing enzyme YbaK/EbsC (Cys-tRNA(Pro) deacylase)